MTAELISVLIVVLAIGATLAGQILTSNRGLRQDIWKDMSRLNVSPGRADRFAGVAGGVPVVMQWTETVWSSPRAHGAFLYGLARRLIREAIGIRGRHTESTGHECMDHG